MDPPRRTLVPLLLVPVLTLGACSSEATPPATATAPPIFAGATASPSIEVPPTRRPTLLADTATPAPIRNCVNNASFVEDLTIPDGSVFVPGEGFDKRWSIRNSGSCDWGADYRLVPIGENRLGGPSEMALYPAKSGSTAIWQIELTAPREPGEYLARWQAQAPDGTRFGDEVFVLIFVEEPTETSSTTPSPTP